VAEEVGAEAGGRLGAVVGAAALRRQQWGLRPRFPVPLRYRDAVQKLPQQVAVPPDTEVARARLSLGNGLPLHVPDAAQPRAGRPRLAAGVARVDVERYPTPDVRARLAPYHLPGPGVPKLNAVGMLWLFMDIED